MLSLRSGIARLRIHDQLPQGDTVSIRGLQQSFQPSPIESLTSLLLEMYKSVGGWSRPDPDTVLLHMDIAKGGDAFFAWIEVTLRRDGTVRFQGHAQTSGIQSFDFAVVPTVSTLGNRAVVMQRSGHVNGTIDPGPRNFDWDEEFASNPLVAAFFDDFQNGWIVVKEKHEGNLTDFFKDIANFAIKWVVGGTIISPGTGLIIFLGAEVGSLVTTGSLVPGARIIEGFLWLAGPAGTLYALGAEGIAAIGTHDRPINQEEYDFANQQVFKGTLPSRDRLILTDSIGAGNRPFTFPRFDGKITINMGADGFDDPRQYHVMHPERRVLGEVFIHELVHAWQIHHATMDILWLADAFTTQARGVAGGMPYKYGNAGPAYSDFNLEQQAQIVSDWFAGREGRDPSTDQITKPPMDQSSPYFRYIKDNIWLGAT